MAKLKSYKFRKHYNLSSEPTSMNELTVSSSATEVFPRAKSLSSYTFDLSHSNANNKSSKVLLMIIRKHN